MRPIAALYVAKHGPYFSQPGVDPWDEERDARLYPGPYPVVAHPPCEMWGRYAKRWHGEVGNDGGCFEAALRDVRLWGGILEHPEGSAAWPRFGLKTPPRSGGWVQADDQGGWTCCVAQGHYGHRGRKLTWLYANGVPLPELNWEPCVKQLPIPPGATEEQRKRLIKTGVVQRMCSAHRQLTPAPFRDLLVQTVRDAW